ncbi:MAG: hypothetical protein ACKV2U_02160 [Bryobacteraceae bacterium]
MTRLRIAVSLSLLADRLQAQTAQLTGRVSGAQQADGVCERPVCPHNGYGWFSASGTIGG